MNTMRRARCVVALHPKGCATRNIYAAAPCVQHCVQRLQQVQQIHSRDEDEISATNIPELCPV
ncbi:MAG: hypothetical protein NTV49_01280 [Kiritimatiellaeota bacterium]|nr:hypothetical protein [Kiritimatiellota bacterium]